MVMKIKISYESETKNFYTFKKEDETHTYDVDKGMLAWSLRELERWQSDPDASNFTSRLFGLMAKADDDNLQKLFLGFPTRTTAYLLWYYSSDKDELFNKYAR